MKTGSEYSFVVKAENNESEEFCSHEHLRKFVLMHSIKFEGNSDPALYLGSDLENIEQAA